VASVRRRCKTAESPSQGSGKLLQLVLPIFTVTGLQQIGPTTAANSDFTTSIQNSLTPSRWYADGTPSSFGGDFRREALTC